MAKALVLLSSGLDSSINFYLAKNKFAEIQALHFNYGQRAALRELECSQRLCDLQKIPLHVVQLPWLKNLGKSALTSEREVPVGTRVQIDDHVVSLNTAEQVWVPNRNGIFLNIAAAFAEAYGLDYVIPGFNLEEAATFPDNTEDYLKALDVSFKFSTRDKVQTYCFTHKMSKTEIVAEGQRLGVDWSLVWPCYFANARPCGECESCQRYRRALITHSVIDARFT